MFLIFIILAAIGITLWYFAAQTLPVFVSLGDTLAEITDEISKIKETVTESAELIRSDISSLRLLLTTVKTDNINIITLFRNNLIDISIGVQKIRTLISNIDRVHQSIPDNLNIISTRVDELYSIFKNIKSTKTNY